MDTAASGTIEGAAHGVNSRHATGAPPSARSATAAPSPVTAVNCLGCRRRRVAGAPRRLTVTAAVIALAGALLADLIGSLWRGLELPNDLASANAGFDSDWLDIHRELYTQIPTNIDAVIAAEYAAGREFARLPELGVDAVNPPPIKNDVRLAFIAKTKSNLRPPANLLLDSCPSAELLGPSDITDLCLAVVLSDDEAFEELMHDLMNASESHSAQVSPADCIACLKWSVPVSEALHRLPVET